jgi:aminopeptidase N
MAHPIRPDSYQEINNFYTATVYQKGAEVIRMLLTLLGTEGFRNGMDLYFSYHDGQAVTCDDFVGLHGRGQWRRSRPLHALVQPGRHAAPEGRGAIRRGLPQLHPDAVPAHAAHGRPAGQAGAAHSGGRRPDRPGWRRFAPAARRRSPRPGDTTRVLELKEASRTWRFTGIDAEPVPSILRGFSAPVILEVDEDNARLAFRMAHDSDPFNRWDACPALHGAGGAGPGCGCCGRAQAGSAPGFRPCLPGAAGE